MLADPKRHEVDHRILRLLVGLIAITLASVASFLSCKGLDEAAFTSCDKIQSISQSYHKGGLARDYFVGSLIAVAMFLFAYNGKSSREMLASKVAGIAAVGVAIIPCQCGRESGPISWHGISAFVMFSVLVYFCYIFYRRARKKEYSQARRRAVLYAFCGTGIVVSMAIVILDYIVKTKIDRIVFWGEAGALVAFGIAWLVASRILPVFSSPEERASLRAAPRPETAT